MRLLPAVMFVVLFSVPALADEGMWTYNNFPVDRVKQKYNFTPTQEWLDHVRLSSVRIAGGCSASVVSADGLVMTNHHCAHSCIEQLSTPKKDFVKEGFFAKTTADEVRCPEIELNQLTEITDVTKRIQEATKGVEDAKFNETQKKEISAIEKECSGGDATLRCEVVMLYRGGRYDLYKYRRFQDVRLVFAPEFGIAFFGGDPDNFMFPRYDLDVSFLRIYSGGDKDGKGAKPAKIEHHLKWASENPKEGDLTFVSGNPGGTSRLLTTAQLEFDRDVKLAWGLARFSELRGMLTEYANRGAEQKRHSQHELFSFENSLKAYKGRHAALADRKFFGAKVVAEKSFRQLIDGDAKLKKDFGNVFDNISATTERARELRKPYLALENFNISNLYGYARTLLRAGDELPKANGDRLREYSEARLPQLKQMIGSKAPLYDEFEVALLAFQLTKLREDLGSDHPVVRKVFGSQSALDVAKAAVKGSKLKDAKVREELLAGGKAKVDAAKDTMIELARIIEPSGRAVRKQWEEEVDGPLKKQGEILARANFAVMGTNTYPDATFTLRLSYGALKGYTEDGKEVKPLTTIGGAFDRATGADPFALPKSWLAAKSKLNLQTPFNLATTNDIIGGNSGSPMVNQKGEVIGLIFDGNIQSLGGDYGFDESVNRAVAVHAAALLESLDKVYGASRLVTEIKAP